MGTRCADPGAAPVECPAEAPRRSSGWGVPNPRTAFQDKGGGKRPGRGRGRKEGYKGRGPAGGNQAGHGGCPRGAASGARRRPGAPRPPGLLGLRGPGDGPESPGGRFQPAPVGAGAGDHLATRCHHAGLRLPLPLPVPAFPGTPLHRTPAGPGLHGPAGHRIPAPPAAARACPGQLPPPLPAPPPGGLPRALQPSPLPAPARLAASAAPGLVGVPGRSHTRQGLGLRTLHWRAAPASALPPSQPKDPKPPGSSVLPRPHPGLSLVPAPLGEEQRPWTRCW